MRLFLTIILITGLLFMTACQTQKKHSKPVTDYQKIQFLTDHVLIALATHNYTSLKKLLSQKEQHLSGQQAALLLWGSKASASIIKRWEAQKTQISIAANQLAATATGEVLTQSQPNRKLVTTQFIFHFSRHSLNEPWRLQINTP